MLHITKRILGALAAVATMAAASSTTIAQEKLKIRMVVTTPATTFFLPYIVPVDLGWYKENGLEVEEVMVNGGANGLRTVISGDGDLTIIGPSIVLSAIIEGARIKSVGAWQKTVDYLLVADKSVTSLKDLAGKVFASADTSDNSAALPKMILKQHGVDTSGIRFVQVGGHAARLLAVEAGKAQATVVNTVTTAIGLRDNKINVISNVADDFPLVGYVFLIARESDLSTPNKRKAIEIFLKGNIIGARYTMDHPDEAAAILFKRTPDITLEMTRDVIKQLNKQNVWGVNGGNDADVVRFTSQISKELGIINREVMPEEVNDNSLADKILAELGKR